MAQYDVGDTRTLFAEFTSDLDTPLDPTTVTLTVTKPDGTATSYTGVGPLNNPAVGRWEKPVTFDQAGVWHWQWTGVGPGAFSQFEAGSVAVGGVAPRYGPCAAWACVEDVRERTRCTDSPPTDAQIAVALDIVSELLYFRSGRQFSGLCEATVRPCRRYSQGPGYWDSYVSRFYASNAPWGACSCQSEPHRACGCGSLDEVTLGGWPLVGIDEVMVDGDVLDPDAYRIDDYAYLVRTDGKGWPCCQRLDLPDTQPGTWSVTYTYGRPIPESGVQAAVDWACEIARGMSDLDCKLPEHVQSITRQGVTMAIVDSFQFLDKGKTGIFSVDAFLTSVNPKGRSRRGTIASPDVTHRVRRAG